MRYPILFTLRRLVAGSGFVAGVEIKGRVLLAEDEGRFVASGVSPGGVVAEGATEHEALRAFLHEVELVLLDVAGGGGPYEAFVAEVERFVAEGCEQTGEEWREAVAAVRRGEVTFDWLGTAPAEGAPTVQVRRLRVERATPDDNPAEQLAVAAA